MKTYSYEAELSYYRGKAAQRNYVRADSYAGENLGALLGDPKPYFEGKRVLDLGAGGCGYTRYVAETLHPALVVAADLFLPHLQNTRRSWAGPAAGFVAADAFRLPFKSGSFDVVFCHLVLHQIPELSRVAREVHRVLHAGGMFLAIEPSPLNPLHLMRYCFAAHSPNQYLLRPRHLRVLAQLGFRTEISFFHPRWGLRTRFGASVMGVRACSTQ